jgi:hypothetical protein
LVLNATYEPLGVVAIVLLILVLNNQAAMIPNHWRVHARRASSGMLIIRLNKFVKIYRHAVPLSRQRAIFYSRW